MASSGLKAMLPVGLNIVSLGETVVGSGSTGGTISDAMLAAILALPTAMRFRRSHWWDKG